jgi:hypothetical protein
VLGIGASFAPGRPIGIWRYEDLLKEADLVVIAKAVGTADTEDALKSDFAVEFVGMDTSFEVQGTLKGNAPGKLVVLHYRIKNGGSPPNGPMLVTFRTNAEAGKGGALSLPPEYLLFLKRRTDGRYEAVTGQIDPVLSVRSVTR